MHEYFKKQSGFLLLSISMLLSLLLSGALSIAFAQEHGFKLLSLKELQQQMIENLQNALDDWIQQGEQQLYSQSIALTEDDFWWNAKLDLWETHGAVVHSQGESQEIIHVIIEHLWKGNAASFFRITGIGYHSKGVQVKEQWMVRCINSICQRLSQRFI